MAGDGDDEAMADGNVCVSASARHQLMRPLEQCQRDQL